MRNPIRLLTALWELGVLGWQTRFRLNGRYWRWRSKTAFGNTSMRPSRRDIRRATLDYARWVHRMKRLR